MMQIFDEWDFATSLRMNTNCFWHIRINQQTWLQNSRFEIRLIRSIRSFFSLLVTIPSQ